jgi:CRISPR-associated protein Csd1
LFESAITGAGYRYNVLMRAIERTRAEIGRLSSDSGKEYYQACRRLDARAALIKAFLNRNKRFHAETKNYQEILPVLDPCNVSPGYLLGQLMAVLEHAQQLAMDANATVVDRYFSGASAAPRSVFVRLLKNSQHHLRKADDDASKAGKAFLLKRLIDQIADRFDPGSNGFPARLSVEQQGLFVLGYHQMRRWLWLKAEERAEWEGEFPQAPAAYRWTKTAS